MSTFGELHVSVQSGSLSGQTFRFSEGPVQVGRDPGCAIPFSPHEDLGVSARHATFDHQDGRWMVADIGSKNGTFVDGVLLDGPRWLEAETQVRLGKGGPVLRLVVSEPAGAPVRTLGARHPALGLVAALGVILLAVLAGLAVRSERASRELRVERAELLALVDSMLAEGAAPATRSNAGASGAPESPPVTRSELESVRARIEAPTSSDPSELDSIRMRLQVARAALSRFEMAPAVAWDAIHDEIARGVGRVLVQDETGQVEVGTAFMVDPSGLFITAAHVVSGEDGGRVRRRMAVQHPGSDVFADAELVSESRADDLALIRIATPTPALPALPLNEQPDTLRVGLPIAIIGFPQSGSTLSPDVASVLVAGILRENSPQELIVQGWSERGGSGSPILDASGAVVGVLRGAFDQEGETLLVAVPSSRLVELMTGSVRPD